MTVCQVFFSNERAIITVLQSSSNFQVLLMSKSLQRYIHYFWFRTKGKQTILKQARSFEIDAMQTAMKTARYVISCICSLSIDAGNYLPSSASTTRAWQVLPRHLRRRAASHNPRRVPLRLRDKARSEVRRLLPFITFILIPFIRWIL